MILSGKVTSVHHADSFIDGKGRVTIRIAEGDSPDNTLRIAANGELDLGQSVFFVTCESREQAEQLQTRADH